MMGKFYRPSKQGDESDTESEDSIMKEIDSSDVPFWASTRFGLAVLGFFGSINLYAMRINLSVAMVSMVNNTALRLLKNNEAHNATVPPSLSTFVNDSSNPNDILSDDGCSGGKINTTDETTTDSPHGEFVWDRATQFMILGAFFWGYLVTQIPGAILASKFGAKRTLGLFMLISSVATAFTPQAARVHYIFLMAIRICVGLGSGMWFPGMHAFWSAWAPPLERSKLMGITYAGTQLGNIITLPLTGLLCKYGFDGGWPCIFYLLGLTGFIWVCLWMWLASDKPTHHRFISKLERDFIHQTLRGQVFHKKEKLSFANFPLKSILLSLPFWSILVMNVTSDWGGYTFMTAIPTYLNDVFKFDIATTGLYAALPYIGFWIFCVVVGFPADYARSHGYLTTTTVRKLSNLIGNGVPAILIVSISFLHCNQSMEAVALLTIGVSAMGFVFCGYVINHVDIAPKYAGVLFGLTNTVAAATGFVAPYINGLITAQQTRESWQTVFYVCAAVFLFGAVFNMIFGSGELQSWAAETNADVQNGTYDLPMEDVERKKPLVNNGLANV